jgi:hypothetical protein
VRVLSLLVVLHIQLLVLALLGRDSFQVQDWRLSRTLSFIENLSLSEILKYSLEFSLQHFLSRKYKGVPQVWGACSHQPLTMVLILRGEFPTCLDHAEVSN